MVTGKRLPGKIAPQDKQLALVTSNGCMLEQVETVKLLGLELDSEMTFTCHVDKLCKKLSQRIGVLNRIKCCLPFKQIILYYNSLVKSVMNYLNVVWHTCSKEILLKVLRWQKRAARVIMDAKPRTSSVLLFNKLQWIPFYEEAKVAKCSVVYKRIQNSVPTYLMNSLKRNCETHDRNTRYSNYNFICPRYKRLNEGGRTFNVTAEQLCNILSLHLKKKSSFKAFKRSYRKQLSLYHFNP